MKTIQLPVNFTKQLIRFPETGMGYQLVKVILKNGVVLNDHKVLNSSVLVLNQDEKFTVEEINYITL